MRAGSLRSTNFPGHFGYPFSTPSANKEPSSFAATVPATLALPTLCPRNPNPGMASLMTPESMI